MFSKKLFFAAGMIAALITPAAASDIIVDNLPGGGFSYIGKGNSKDSMGGDNYDIYSMEVSRENGIMIVKINSGFVSHAENSRYKFGDLLMSVKSEGDDYAWDPKERSRYNDDDFQTTGTTWEYAYDINDATNKSGDFTDNSGRLVSINNPTSESSYNFGSQRVDGRYANDHIWTTKGRKTTDLNIGLTHKLTANTAGNYLEFVFDVSGTALFDAKQIAFHWTMSCANDIIEGEVQFAGKTPSGGKVPEPAALGLLLLGLTGVGVARRRKLKT
ncbi:MAG: hypothetical protein COB54_05970 [Alphaproteobacteria bacterium]|nr:MAG: hypothetical protein COB54_05970 [Alphaproteobacteria bacterium]